ncbi:unnamed protein product [Adineta ricciae]|uniref:F-box domain-containing protein n=1 Tax=Adineta ricciae TaxID=249248 RepID=A0A815PYL4_ADIRI|nr:unnamed protein product [Adineta ricciae]CAF1579335.1 unnamed protein product [Adineta ricciae]
MEYSCTRLSDLPDEILMMICRNLNNFDVHYSFEGINLRFDRIVHDSLFTSRLSFVTWMPYDFIGLLNCDVILNRYCLQILPDIHDKVKRLDLETSSMRQVLRAADYSILNSLALYNITEKSIHYLSVNETLSYLKNQITTLTLSIDGYDGDCGRLESIANIFNSIFVVFPRLTTLTLHESSYSNRARLDFADLLLPDFRSTTLRQLTLNVQCFDDCLRVLDGRFSRLHTLCVDLTNLHSSHEIQSRISCDDLPNLKRFSISCNLVTCDYDIRILPLLRRMFNLEELSLCLTVWQGSTYIDGNKLKKDIIDHMSQLNRFSFSIDSFIITPKQIDLPSAEDIQRTFVDFSNTKVISCVDYFPEANQARCLCYSYPPLTQYCGVITNNFLGGLFINVRLVSLFDERPFEHEFFNEIRKSFPHMERLAVKNDKAQHFRQFHGPIDGSENLSVIDYPFLNQLIIVDVHDDYIEQFLLHSRACFQGTTLFVKYTSLERVTRHFTRDETRINCAKINKLVLYGDTKRSSCLQEYFPHAQICYRRIF